MNASEIPQYYSLDNMGKKEVKIKDSIPFLT